jgi:transposase
MVAITGTILDEEVPRARVALLLKHFSELGDDREPWRVMYPLHEVLLLVTCATIAACDDFDDIVAWGKHHLDFRRRQQKLVQSNRCKTGPGKAVAGRPVASVA